jgi:hypothetical protein
MKSTKNTKLKSALENLLRIAQGKLNTATEKNKESDIKHYKNDVTIIENQLKGLD